MKKTAPGATGGRDKPKRTVCGWCAQAARTVAPVLHHRRCYGPCACGAVGHKFDADIAATIARVTRLDIDTIYERHGRKRRKLTPEQREAAIARLAAARERKAS